MSRPIRIAASLLAILLVAACGDDDGAAAVEVAGYVHAGPMCAAESVPPDPDCFDRPVDGAVILVRNSTGVVVAEPRTSDDGHFTVRLSVGEYTFIPQPVDGLMGVAADQTVNVSAGMATLDFAYDTGIR